MPFSNYGNKFTLYRFKRGGKQLAIRTERHEKTETGDVGFVRSVVVFAQFNN